MHKETVPRKCLISHKLREWGDQVPRHSTRLRNQVLPSFPCPSSRPPGRPGSSQRMLGAPLLPLPPSAGVCATGASGPSPRCCRCPGFCRRKEPRMRVWLRSRRLGEAERGAFAVAVAWALQAPQQPGPRRGQLSPCGPAVSLLSTPQFSPQICSVTHMKRGRCTIFSWSSWPGIVAFRPGLLEASKAEAPHYSLVLAGG